MMNVIGILVMLPIFILYIIVNVKEIRKKAAQVDERKLRTEESRKAFDEEMARITHQRELRETERQRDLQRAMFILESAEPAEPYRPNPKFKGRRVRSGRAIPLVIKYNGRERITTRPVIMHDLIATVHSDRTITPISINATCLLAKADRTFMMSRIVGVIDVEGISMTDEPACRIVDMFGFDARTMRPSHAEKDARQ